MGLDQARVLRMRLYFDRDQQGHPYSLLAKFICVLAQTHSLFCFMLILGTRYFLPGETFWLCVMGCIWYRQARQQASPAACARRGRMGLDQARV
jgi:hypothetical protein